MLKGHVITILLEVWKKEITSWGKDNESAPLHQNCSGEIMGAEYTNTGILKMRPVNIAQSIVQARFRNQIILFLVVHCSCWIFKGAKFEAIFYMSTITINCLMLSIKI